MFPQSRLRHVLALGVLAMSLAAAHASDEFVGPFADWADLRRDYGAVGDGATNDAPALQRALNEIGTTGKPSTLWIPAGTYLIAAPVTMTARQGVSIFGASPQTTVLRWGGNAPAMLTFMGVGYSRHGRFTCDGMGRNVVLVRETWDGTTGNYVSENEYADINFANASIGLDIGQPHFGDAESAVLRCIFTACGTGARVNSFNVLDWWFWHCRFEDCGQGVQISAGHCHVYGSQFYRSTVQDIDVQCGGYMSFRGNHSAGSRRFYQGEGIGANSANVTLQDNVIIDATDIPIYSDAIGPIMLLDNAIRSAQGQSPAIRLASSGMDATSVGNHFTIANALQVEPGARFRQLDDRIVDPTSINANAPRMPPTPAQRNQPLYMLPVNADAVRIQATINDAIATNGGQRPIIRFPAGEYHLAQTVVIPAGADVQLVGESMLAGSNIFWDGAAGGTMFRLRGPSQVGISDVMLIAPGATAIEATEADQAQGRVWAHQIYSICEGSNVIAQQLAGTRLELVNYGHSGGTSSPSVVVDGATCAIFGGASSDMVSAYTVDHGGRLLVQDMWYETGTKPTFLKLVGTGDFCLSGARVAVPWSDSAIAFQFDGFRGNASVLNAQVSGRIVVESTCGADANVLFAGVQHDNRSDVLQNHSASAHVALMQNRFFHDGSWNFPDVGTVDDASLRAALALTRTVKPSAWPLAATPAGNSDVRLNRVHFLARNGLRVSGGGTFAAAAPTFDPPGGTFTSALAVAIASATGGASIRYTIDGSTPSATSGSLYTGPITIDATTTVRALAFGTGLSPSAVSSATFVVDGDAVTGPPTFSPPAGTYSTAQAVTITSATSGAGIRYTVDGSTPTSTTGLLYDGPISVSATTTVRAIAFATGRSPSAVTSSAYTIDVHATTAAPIFDPPGGAFATRQSVTITSATNGASIRYTVDGSTPTMLAGNVYEGPISIDATTTLRAVAFAGDGAASATTSATYTINPGDAAPSARSGKRSSGRCGFGGGLTVIAFGSALFARSSKLQRMSSSPQKSDRLDRRIQTG